MLGNNLLRESFFMDNLVDVGIATVENRNFLCHSAEHVYLSLPKNITLDIDN